MACGGAPCEVAKVGKPAPEWSGQALATDLDFVDLKSEDYKGKWLVLFSYPLDFTFVCPTEIWAFSEAAAKFKEIDCEVVGLSVDSVYTHLGWVNTDKKEGGLGPIQIPLIGDLGAKIAKKFGFYNCDMGHCIRGTAIIDPDGNVLHLSANHPDVGRNIDEFLRLVKGYQFARAHGQVCPAKWQEGAATITPDPKAAKTFFSAQ